MHRPSPELVENVADTLGRGPSYFAEWREHLVVERVRSDPTLRDELYDGLAGERRRKR